MEPKRGLLNASMHIVMQSFCQFLPSSLLLCYGMAVAIVPHTSFLPLTVVCVYNHRKPNPNPNPNPNANSSPNSIPDPASGIHFHFDACRVCIRLTLCLVISLTGVFIGKPDMAPAMAFGLVGGAFVIFLMLELMVGFVYTALTLRSLATFCPIVEESRTSVQAMERWSFSFVRSWVWVLAGIAMVLYFLNPEVGFISLDSRILSEAWTCFYACAFVGALALLFLYIRFTQVALYLASKTYHKECKENLITHTAQRADDDLNNS